ncbi:MAG: GWxTD domain-containing protein [Balneolaceae bacterium]
MIPIIRQLYITAVSTLVLLSIVQAEQTDRFEQGLLAEFRGEYEQALTIWGNAKNELDDADSRIGFEYIRLATEQEMKEYYQQASEMYYWALTAPLNGVNRAAIRQEIERLRPIIGHGIYRQWVSWWEDRNPNLSRELRGFWVQLNPTPSYLYNERLIEHWERIAYSRRNFVKNRNSPYTTDDRAMIYVRYGEPDRSKAGVFTVDNQNIGHWLSQQFEHQQVEDPDPESGEIVYPNLENEDSQSFSRLENYIFQFHEYPEYEIWIYDQITPNSHQNTPLIFIFGTEVETGKYYRQKSIDDFIPERAFLSDKRALNIQSEFVREGLTPALILQMLYYEQLISVDSYFEQRLNSLRSAFIEQGPLAYASLDLAMRSQNRELLDIRISEAPRHISNLDQLIPRIPLQIYQYRLLDEDNHPYMITFVESDPAEVLHSDIQNNRKWITNPGDEPVSDETGQVSKNLIDSVYSIRHSFQVYDKNWNLKNRFDHSPALLPSQLSEGSLLSSTFELSHEEQLFQSASVELLNTHPDKHEIPQSLFPDELRGIGSLQYQQPMPLENKAGSLEVGDLILGYRDEVPEEYPFSFRVANDQTIPGDENLVLHFEVYNLEPREETGFTHFQLAYRIYPVSDAGKVLENQEQFYLTLNFESEYQRVIEDLEIQTSSLEQGLYELQVFIQDLENQQERDRRIRFEIYGEKEQ